MKNELRAASGHLNKQELTHFLISHLNRIYCAKGQLLEKLPEFAKSCYSRDMKQAINVTIQAVRNQVELLKKIYITLGSFYRPESCIGLVGILDEAFQSIGKPEDSTNLRGSFYHFLHGKY